MSIDISCEEKTTMLSNSLTHLEDFSNEIFYEIFEYIEYSDLFNAFSNLNDRFQNLLNYSFLSLKIHLGSTEGTVIRNYYTQFVIPNKHRIGSLYLIDRSNIIIPALVEHLVTKILAKIQELLVLDSVRPEEFVSFFPVLPSLSRLFSITIHFNGTIADLTEIYRSIVRLPVLKNLEISAKGNSLLMPLTINTSGQYSPIKRLIINHACNLKKLIALLSNTPLLTQLICEELTQQDHLTLRDISIKMIHLTSITFNICKEQFHQLKIFIEKICQQLRVLCVNTSEDVTYLDANGWERLIIQHMPYLRLFKFEYHELHYENIDLTSHDHLFHQFTSLFWINRGWYFQITADIDYWLPMKLIYSIQSDRKKWDQNTKTKLIIDRLYFATCRERLANVFFSFISKMHITHLHVDCKKLLYSNLMILLSVLPDLQLLEILSLCSFQLKDLSPESVKIWSDNNKITKLVVNSFMEETDLEKIQFFINLCPQLEYLKVKCEGIFNIQSIGRYILMKNSDKYLHWNSFCLWVPTTNDDMVNQLQAVINREKLISHWRITCTTDRIYLQRN